MGSVFVVHHGAADPTLRAAPQVADSIYYVLPSVVERPMVPMVTIRRPGRSFFDQPHFWRESH
jgi:hypothetical protein